METQLLSRLLLLCTRSPSWLPFSLSSHSIVLPLSLILSCVSFSHVPVLHSGSPSLFICLSLVFSRSLILPCTRSPSRPPASLLSSLSLSSLSPSQSVSLSFMYSFPIQAPCLYLFICFSFFPRLSVFVLLYPLICHPPSSLISFLFFPPLYLFSIHVIPCLSFFICLSLFNLSIFLPSIPSISRHPLPLFLHLLFFFPLTLFLNLSFLYICTCSLSFLPLFLNLSHFLPCILHYTHVLRLSSSVCLSFFHVRVLRPGSPMSLPSLVLHL